MGSTTSAKARSTGPNTAAAAERTRENPPVRPLRKSSVMRVKEVSTSSARITRVRRESRFTGHGSQGPRRDRGRWRGSR